MRKAYPEQICNLYENTGIDMFNRGELDFAEELLRSACEWTDRCRETQSRLLVALNNLAVTLFYKGGYDEAEHLFLRVINTIKDKAGLFHPDLPTILSNYAAMLFQSGRELEAEGMRACAEVLRSQVCINVRDSRLLCIAEEVHSGNTRSAEVA